MRNHQCPRNAPPARTAVEQRKDRVVRRIQAIDVSRAWSGRFECRAEAEAYLSRDTIECLICRKDGFGELGFHVRSQHGVTAKEYRKRFNIPRDLCLTSASARARLNLSPGIMGRQANRRIREECWAILDWDGAVALIVAGTNPKEAFTGRSRMPSHNEYTYRRKIDPEFREMIDSTPYRGGPITADEEAVIVERLKAGEPICKIA